MLEKDIQKRRERASEFHGVEKELGCPWLCLGDRLTGDSIGEDLTVKDARFIQRTQAWAGQEEPVRLGVEEAELQVESGDGCLRFG